MTRNTPEQKAAVADLWEQGLSTAEIGRRIGMTKNAVAGIVRRTGLPPRPSPIKPRRGNIEPIRRKAIAGPTLPPIEPSNVIAVQLPQEERDMPPDPPTGRVEPCKWPLSDGKPWRFCEADSEPGRIYCRFHSNLATSRHSADDAKFVPQLPLRSRLTMGGE